jgi:hypothetical protein
MSTSQLRPLSSSGIVNKSHANRSDAIRRYSGYFLESNPIAVIPSELTTSAKCADDKSNLISVPSSARIKSRSLSSSNTMCTRIMRGLRASMYFSDTRISKEALAQLRKSFRPSLSSSELIFLHTVCEQGLRRATFLAAISHWQFQRPLQALLAASNALGRSYNARSAKRKRLSNSPASSRKRS